MRCSDARRSTAHRSPVLPGRLRHHFPDGVRMSRNRTQWLSMAAFLKPLSGPDLATHAHRVGAWEAKRLEGAPLAGEVSGRAARLLPHPDGNHGDNDFCHRQQALGEAR